MCQVHQDIKELLCTSSCVWTFNVAGAQHVMHTVQTLVAAVIRLRKKEPSKLSAQNPITFSRNLAWAASRHRQITFRVR